MTRDEAIQVIEALLDGQNPVTSAALPENDTCRLPQVREALQCAYDALCLQGYNATDDTAKSKGKKPNAGRGWMAEETEMLNRMVELGLSDEDIAFLLMRRARGVRNHLNDIEQGVTRRGAVWTDEEDATMKAAWGSKPVAEIARDLGRSEWGVCCHAELLGLVPEGTYIRR